MVEVPQVQIPDFGASIARGQAVQQSRLQGLLAQQAYDESQRFNSALPGLSGALATGQGPAYDSALATLLGTGQRGAAIALPLIQRNRDRTEAANFNWGATAPVQPAAPAGAAGVRTGAAIQVPAGLDDADILTRTILGEAANQGEEGQRAVAGVIRNRMTQTGAGLRDVVLAPNQFEPWGSRRQELIAISPNDPRYVAARRIAEETLAGRGADPTNGATHFLNPDLQRQLGRQQPSWAPEGQGQRIGGHVFYRPGGGVLTGAQAPQGDVTPASGPVTPGQAAPQALPGGMTPALAVALERALNSGNPVLVAAAQHRIQLMQLQQRDTTDSYQPAVETIGGRPIQGQRNARTGQFTPYPGQTSEAGLSPAQANATVARLGPRIARGEITPDSQEYNDYSAAYAIATRPQQVWVDDPNNPGNQRMTTVPGIVFDPARFPNPVTPTYGAEAAAPVATPATSATAPVGAPIGASGMVADSPNDAAAVRPGGVSRQAPNTTPSGEENLAAGYARRMVEAEGLLGQAVSRGYVPGNMRDAAASAVAGGRDAGLVRRSAGNAAMSTEGQLYRQAQEDWVRAKLRRESGAVIGEDEMAREIHVYFPQPGDSQAVIAQKAESRRVAIDAMRQGAGRAGPSVPGQAAAPEQALRRRGEDALARARRELPGASDDAIVERARSYMQ